MEAGMRHRPATHEIGPAVPGSRQHLIQEIRAIGDRAAAPIVGALIGGKQAAVGQEAESVSVAQPPRDQFEISAVGIAPHHRGGTRNVARDAPSRLVHAADGAESAIRGMGKHHIQSGNIAVVGHLAQPRKILRIGPKPMEFALRHFDRDVFIYQPTGESAGGPAGLRFSVEPGGRADRVLIENLSNADGISGNDNNTFDIGGFSISTPNATPIVRPSLRIIDVSSASRIASVPAG